MPTTEREQLLVGIHQTERVLQRVQSTERRAKLADELDALLDQVRAPDADVVALTPELHRVHLAIVQASR